jgi:hypothetical protein
MTVAHNNQVRPSGVANSSSLLVGEAEGNKTPAPPFGFLGFQLVASKGWVKIGDQIEPLFPSL